MRLFYTFIFGGAILGAAILASPAHATTLNQALAHALGKNPSYQSARFNYKASYSGQFVVLANMLPRVTAYAEETRGKTSFDVRNAGSSGANPFLDAGGKLDTDTYGVELRQTIFASGKHINAYLSNRAQVKASRHQLAETQQQILLAAITVYFDVVQADAVVSLNKSNLDVLQKQLQAQQDRFDVGVSTRTAVAQAEAGVANARASLLGAQAEHQSARATYREIIGIEPENLSKPIALPNLPSSLADALNIARSENPLLHASKEAARSARLSFYSAIGDALPNIELTARYSYTEDPSRYLIGVDREQTSISVRLNVPIIRGGGTFSGIDAAQYAASAVRSDVRTASNMVERGVVAAWSNYQATNATIPARQKQIQASGIALDGIREENNLGTSTILDVLDTEQNYLDARVALVRAERNRFVAMHALLANMGRLTAGHMGITPASATTKR